MKYLICIFIFLFTNAKIFAQPIAEQIIADSSYGWIKVYNFKGYKTIKKLGTRTFSANQLSICDSFANWIQASYLPKGTIGDVRKVIIPEIGLYNKHQQFAPQAYGATSFIWSLYMKNGKPTPIRETEIPWGITANEVPGQPMENLCTNGDYYFFMDEKNPFDDNTPADIIAKYNIKTLPQFDRFHTTHSTASRYDRNANFVEAVLICKDNKLPFIQVTVGDLLNKAEKMLQDAHVAKISDIIEKNNDNQKSIDYFTGYENENFKKAIATIARHKEKYKNQLNDFATIPNKFDYIDFVNGNDIFTRAKMDEKTIPISRFPIYKFAHGVVEQSKQDKPLWIRVSWYWSLSEERMRHMHESIINNFNFQYLYNFFFAPEKVKGHFYMPLRSPHAKQAPVISDKSEIAKKASLNKTIHFFEDFSTNVPGAKPEGWYSETSMQGNYSKVSTPEKANEKWLEVKGHRGLLPNNLKKPLPQNFELSFDIAVPKGFTWGAKAFEMYLGSEGWYIENGQRVLLRIKPGFDGNAGETSLQGSFGAGYFNGTKAYYNAPGFSNNGSFNHIKISLIKQGETLTYFINGKIIVSISKAIPVAVQFNWLQFTHLRSEAESEKYYITNIKITDLK